MRYLLAGSLLAASVALFSGCGFYVYHGDRLTFIGPSRREVAKRCDPFNWRDGWAERAKAPWIEVRKVQ